MRCLVTFHGVFFVLNHVYSRVLGIGRDVDLLLLVGRREQSLIVGELGHLGPQPEHTWNLLAGPPLANRHAFDLLVVRTLIVADRISRFLFGRRMDHLSVGLTKSARRLICFH